jgi:hypothetical protein
VSESALDVVEATAGFRFRCFAYSMARLDEADALCAAMAESQYGVFNRTQARRAGHNDSSINRRISKGTWRRVFHTVYTFGGTPLTWDARCMAAILLDPGRCALAGPTAARVYKGDGFGDGDIEIATVANRNRPAPGIRVRRLGLHLLDHVHVIRGLPTTTPPLTVLHMAGRRARGADRLMDHCLRSGAANLLDFWALLDRRWTRGQRGIRWYRDALSHRTAASAPTHSDLEDMFLKLVRDFDLPQPLGQWPMVLPTLGLIHFDFGYPDQLLAIELDGYVWHMDRAAFERDRQRDLEAQALGIRVIRLTWPMLKWRREYVARMLRSHLSTSSALSLT